MIGYTNDAAVVLHCQLLTMMQGSHETVKTVTYVCRQGSALGSYVCAKSSPYSLHHIYHVAYVMVGYTNVAPVVLLSSHCQLLTIL